MAARLSTFFSAPASIVLLAVLIATPVRAQQDVITLQSPNGEIEFRMSMVPPPTDELALEFPAYQVDFHGKLLMDTSFMGFQLYEQVPLGGKLGLEKEIREEVDETYTLPVGKTSTVRNRYNMVHLDYLQNGTTGRRLSFEIRAYDDGIAFRYIIPWTALTADIRLVNEITQFHFAKDGDGYPLVLPDYQTNYEDQYVRQPLSSIHSGDLVGMPFLVEQPGVGWVAVTEADLDEYPGSYLYREDGTTFVTDLPPQVDGSGLVLHKEAPVTTPWRVLLIGDEPQKLIESNIITNLNPPSEIEDTSWIQAGKAAWNWWNGTQADDVDFTPGMNTPTMLHYIDFAAKQGLEYMLIDAGWATPLDGGPTNAADLTRPIDAIDMEEILGHAKESGVGVWLWARWNSVDAQMEEAFSRFEEWGVKGVKIDYMDRDDVWMVDWYRKVAAAAAEHHLMLDFHGAFKPDGLRRTYPNVVTREGVLGLEYMKWSERTTPRHDATLPFTRMLAGPMDYTPGGFRQRTAAEFYPRNDRPFTRGTRAHQLALYVVFESPLQMVSDYPEAYTATEKDARDFQFIRDVPTTWDETRGLAGEVGEYVAVARRAGDAWYLGAIAGMHGHTVEIPLEFLGSGNWTAEIYRDAGDSFEHPTATVVESKKREPRQRSYRWI